MFEHIQAAPPDPILGLNEAFKGDPRPHKINLGVGVYKDSQGRTPVLDCVQRAERLLLERGRDKNYLAIDGLPEYGSLVRELLLGAETPAERVATSQTPGGTGALRVAADFLRRALPQANIWCSAPTWANHPAIFTAAGFGVENYAYADSAGRSLDFPALLAALGKIPAGDIVLLHACCHNPTGIDPTPEQWGRIAATMAERQLLPLVDMAYQGFGDGVAEDALGLRTLAAACPELLVCSSFSKNFGLYGERVGALTLVAQDAAGRDAAQSHIKVAIRTNYSNPPLHGAAVVATVLADNSLRALWEQEVAQMRERIHSMRRLFVDTMAQLAPSHDFGFLIEQRGMFSNSGLTRLQVDQLRSEHAVYIVGNGRINVAGMTEQNMGPLCQAIAAVL